MVNGDGMHIKAVLRGVVVSRPMCFEWEQDGEGCNAGLDWERILRECMEGVGGCCEVYAVIVE